MSLLKQIHSRENENVPGAASDTMAVTAVEACPTRVTSIIPTPSASMKVYEPLTNLIKARSKETIKRNFVVDSCDAKPYLHLCH